MADQPLRRDEREATFTIASSSIPAGVRCGACGRLHLPHRLRALASPEDGGVWLGCQRCGAIGPLVLDDRDPMHQEILRSIRPSDSPPANP